MKIELEKIEKIYSIVNEMYEMNPKFFIDALFDTYYKMKRKQKIDEVCKGDPDLIKRTWGACDFFKKMMNEKQHNIEKAAFIACRHYNIEIDQFISLITAFNAFKGAKGTKFKNLL